MKKKTTKVVVAMSGGVDSSVAAALLKQKGYDVIGITMKLTSNDASDRCCSLSAVEDARRVANQLDIPFYVVNFKDIFKKVVINNFISEYENGRTPNPCVICNTVVKFDALLKKAKSLGAKYIATGHYANIAKVKRRYVLKKGKDPLKDQSYFLYGMSQEALASTLFPVGNITKKQVREIAAKLNLKVANKPESQEICFVEGPYKALFKPKKGNIRDISGKVIGKHNGYQLYTVGQRRGLGISSPEPKYVVKIVPKTNEIVVGDKGDVYSDDLTTSSVNLISVDKVSKPVNIKARIRHKNPESDAKLLPLSQGKLKVMFKVPQFAVTPGQSVVFYKGNTVIGGGIIESTKSDVRS